MATDVPAQYQSLIQNAATATGIPYAVVAAQINDESGFDPTAVSPTGAEGLAQFEPGTWATYGSGSPDNPADAMAAYAKYMSVLLKQYSGNLQDALAAYNAGPGDIQAGMGYANSILTAAGSGDITVGGGTGSGSDSSTQGLVPQWLQDLNPVTGFLGGSVISGFIGAAGSIGDVGTAIASMATEFGTVIAWLKYLFSPSLWLRVGAFWFGLILLTGGVVMLVKSA